MNLTITNAVRKLMKKLSRYWKNVVIFIDPFRCCFELKKVLFEAIALDVGIEKCHPRAVFTERDGLVSLFFQELKNDGFTEEIILF
jgi:hypothetical protein